MKEIIITKFGPPEVLQIRERAAPSARKDEVLVRNHFAGINFSDNIRYMFKVRLAPTEKQELLWDPEKKYKPLSNRALFWTDENTDITVNDILTKKYPWQENDTHRLDIINRIKMWRLLTGDSNLDIDYWMTRVENERY